MRPVPTRLPYGRVLDPLQSSSPPIYDIFHAGVELYIIVGRVRSSKMLWTVNAPPNVDQKGRRERIAALANFREDILRIARAYGATNVRIVPSLSPMGMTAEHPLELLVDVKPTMSLRELGRLQYELAMFLDVWVKVTTKDGVSAERLSDFIPFAVPL